MTDVSTRTAIVTGGARGIGAAIGTRLAADGMAVGLLDPDEAGAEGTAGLITEGGGRAVGVLADVTDEASVVGRERSGPCRGQRACRPFPITPRSASRPARPNGRPEKPRN